MGKQFTAGHYKHIKESGFNPQICRECQEIDYILNRIATYGDATTGLYEALSAVYQDIDLTGVEGGSSELNVMVSQALSKAGGGK